MRGWVFSRKRHWISWILVTSQTRPDPDPTPTSDLNFHILSPSDQI